MMKTPLLPVLLLTALTAAAAAAPRKDVTLFWVGASADDATATYGICDGMLSKAKGKGMVPHLNPKIADKWIADASGGDIDVQAGQELRIFLRNAARGRKVSFWLDDQSKQRLVDAEVPEVESCGVMKVKYAEKGNLARFNPDYRCEDDAVGKESEGWTDHICIKVPADIGEAKWTITPFSAESSFSAPTTINIHPS